MFAIYVIQTDLSDLSACRRLRMQLLLTKYETISFLSEVTNGRDKNLNSITIGLWVARWNVSLSQLNVQASDL